MRTIALVIGLILLAGGCATVEGTGPAEPAQAKKSLKSEQQDFSSPPEYLEQRAKQRKMNPFL